VLRETGAAAVFESVAELRERLDETSLGRSAKRKTTVQPNRASPAPSP
jgi:hypothetical protein